MRPPSAPPPDSTAVPVYPRRPEASAEHSRPRSGVARPTTATPHAPHGSAPAAVVAGPHETVPAGAGAMSQDHLSWRATLLAMALAVEGWALPAVWSWLGRL